MWVQIKPLHPQGGAGGGGKECLNDIMRLQAFTSAPHSRTSFSTS